jgi:hypothetical protein
MYPSQRRVAPKTEDKAKDTEGFSEITNFKGTLLVLKNEV